MVGYGDFGVGFAAGVFDLIGWFRGLVVWILSGFCLVELVLVFWVLICLVVFGFGCDGLWVL